MVTSADCVIIQSVHGVQHRVSLRAFGRQQAMSRQGAVAAPLNENDAISQDRLTGQSGFGLGRLPTDRDEL